MRREYATVARSAQWHARVYFHDPGEIAPVLMQGKHAQKWGQSQYHEGLYRLPALTLALTFAFGFTRGLALDFNLGFTTPDFVLPAVFALGFFCVEAAVTLARVRLPRLVRFPVAGFDAGTAARYSSSYEAIRQS